MSQSISLGGRGVKPSVTQELKVTFTVLAPSSSLGQLLMEGER